MLSKFAYFTFPKSRQEIPVKPHWIWKMPNRFVAHYIRKYNPIVIEEVSILDAEGYQVQLPILKDEIQNKKGKDLDKILTDTLMELKERHVEIMIPPTPWPMEVLDTIRTADGKEIFPFFVFPAMQKALKLYKKDLQFAEIVILDGRDKKTEVIIDFIYPNVNYLSIITDEPDRFETKIEEIYDDVGLNLQVLAENKEVLRTADVIINLSRGQEQYDYYYKRGAIYLDLVQDPKRVSELLRKRQDILVVDDILLKSEEQYITTTYCELAWYAKSRAYRTYLLHGYNKEDLEAVRSQIDLYNIGVSGFYQQGILLKSSLLTEILKNSGVE